MFLLIKRLKIMHRKYNLSFHLLLKSAGLCDKMEELTLKEVFQW